MSDLYELVEIHDVKGILKEMENNAASKALFGPAPKTLSRSATEYSDLGEKAIEPLIKDMFAWTNPWDYDIRCLTQVIRLLGGEKQLGAQCLSILIAGNQPQRYTAAYALSELFHPKYGVEHWPAEQDLQPLISASTDADRGVRMKALPAYFKALSKGFLKNGNLSVIISRETDQEVRGNAIEVLGETKNPVFLQPLLETLEKDSSDFVRAMAAVSLGELGDRKAKDALKRALKDRKNAADERIVRNAKSALEKLN